MAVEELPVGQRLHAVVQQVAEGVAVLVTVEPAGVEVRLPAQRLMRGIRQGDLIAIVADPVARDGVHVGPPDPDADQDLQRRRREAGDRLRPVRGHRSNRLE